MLLNEFKLFHAIMAVRNDIKALTAELHKEKVDYNYSCPECGYHNNPIYRVYSTYFDAAKKQFKRYVACNQCNAHILQRVINVKTIKKGSVNE